MKNLSDRINEEKSKWLRLLKRGLVSQERYDRILDKLETEGHTMNYEIMTDAELTEIRKGLPKYLNDCTPEQAEISHAAYQEQKRRFDVKKATEITQYNADVEKAGYKVGDKVSYFARSMLGIGGMEITGKVAKRKKYYVKLDVAFNGKKTAHLTKAWRIEEWKNVQSVTGRCLISGAIKTGTFTFTNRKRACGAA